MIGTVAGLLSVQFEHVVVGADQLPFGGGDVAPGEPADAAGVIDLPEHGLDLALEWATSTINVPVNDALFARRMDAARIFARYQHAIDPARQVPADTICNRKYQPRAPNSFSQAEVLALLAAAATPVERQLRQRHPGDRDVIGGGGGTSRPRSGEGESIRHYPAATKPRPPHRYLQRRGR